MLIRSISIIGACFELAALGHAAEFSLQSASELRGRWESVTFVSTNFDILNGATNLSLCVYGAGAWHTNSFNARFEATLDAELRLKDRTGRERLVSDSFGPALITDDAMLFGGPGGFLLNYSLKGDSLVLQKHVALGEHRVSLRAVLRKVASDPGKRIQQ